MKTKTIKFLLIQIFALVLVASIFAFTPSAKVCHAEQSIEMVEDTIEAEEPKEEKKSEWTVYFEEKIMPYIISIGAAVGLILSVVLPVILKIKNAANQFKSATDNVTKTNKRTEENDKRIASLESRLNKIETASMNTEDIVRIGFGNMEEMVSKGFSAEIAKVGKDEKSKD